MVRDAEYLVVGAGSSGAILASRLSEDAGVRVVLIEAGRNYRSADTVEALRAVAMSPSLEVQALPDYYWLDLTASRSARQQRQFYWRGKGVGGSSAINGQVAFRPPPEDFADWVELGCTGWDWDSVLPYLIRLEDDKMFGDAPYHGDNGPMPVCRATEESWSSLDIVFRDAALRAGHPWEPDTNAPNTTGCGYYAFHSRDGRRVNTNDAYLEPARARDNVAIRGNVTVDRVLFEGTRAVGVRILDTDGVPEDVHADHVILCAGTVGSASILLRSGIGPADHLCELEIPLRVALPVGENIQDHANVGISFGMEPNVRQGLYRPVCCVRYTTGIDGGGRNDAFIGASGPFAPTLQMGALMAWLNQCFSQGVLRLVSADPRIDAVVDINLLADRRDRLASRHILGRVAELLQDPAFAGVIAGEPAAADKTPLTEILRMTDAEFDEWAPGVVRDVAHLTGSCRMGDPNDGTTVVDPECRVLGVDHLRVVDASIFPRITRGNTGFPAMMVAERMADVLRGRAAVNA